MWIFGIIGLSICIALALTGLDNSLSDRGDAENTGCFTVIAFIVLMLVQLIWKIF